MIFDDITAIGYEGQRSTNPLAFKYYKADEIVLGRTMADWTFLDQWLQREAQ